MKDTKIFKYYMALLGEIHATEIKKKYPDLNGTLPDHMKELYWKILKPYGDNDCKIVFEILITTSKWFPKPGEFTELLVSLSPPKSRIAWDELMKAAREYHPGVLIDFNDKKISLIVKKMGGFLRFVNITDKEISWVKKEFEMRYSEGQETPARLLSEGRNNEGVKRLEILTKKVVG